MKKFALICIALTMLACSKEDEICSSSDFIGTWKVVNNICSIDNSMSIDIFPGDFASQVKLKLGLDTIAFNVINCNAYHENKDFLVGSEATLELSDDEIELDYNGQILLLLQFCKMTLKRE